MLRVRPPSPPSRGGWAEQQADSGPVGSQCPHRQSLAVPSRQVGAGGPGRPHVLPPGGGQGQVRGPVLGLFFSTGRLNMNAEFVSQRQASLLSGKGAYSVAVAALRGKVRVLLEPGSQIKYHAEDAKALRGDATDARKAR